MNNPLKKRITTILIISVLLFSQINIVFAQEVSTTSASSEVTSKVDATSSLMLVGKVSWYDYFKMKKIPRVSGFFAASPDFPMGSRLRVYNQNDNNKFVDVTVNDYGPDRIVHPDRLIDLDRAAFEQLASLGVGVLTNVRIEQLELVKSSSTALLASHDEAKINNQTSNDLDLDSTSAIVISARTGRVIWQKNSDKQLPLASLTKIVAAKVFLDTKPKLSKVVTYKKIDDQLISKWADPSVIARVRVKNGETMTINDLLYSALLGSANNAVESLVRVSGLTRAQFVTRMNKYAKKVGAKNTFFEEPTGLSPNNVSSAKDYALISRDALKNPTLTKVTSTKSYKFKTINTKQPHLINNTNKLMSWTDLKITGSKTGYLEEAQYCLMTKASGKYGEVVAVTFGTPTKSASFEDNKKLLAYGFVN